MSAIPVLRWAALGEIQRRDALARAPQTCDPQRIDDVANIIRDVRARGDIALREWTQRLDGVMPTLRVSEAEMRAAGTAVTLELLAAIDQAVRNLEAFHKAQSPGVLRVETQPGVVCERRPVPLQRVGLYVPGGSTPLISTVLMLGVPARLAGCAQLVMCTPPGADGRVAPAIQAAAWKCGIRQVFAVGGAQAVAAMAYGTQSVPKVDKLFGPGNAWVTEAKRQVSAHADGAACDLPAGPSEVMVIADAHANPDWVAADLLSQMEHGPDSQALLVTPSETLAQALQITLADQLKTLPRRDVAEKALRHSRVLLVDSLEQAIEVANAYAPEHLLLNTVNADALAASVTAAGGVFVGAMAPEAAGDYATGANHVLPTYGWARSVPGLSLEGFFNWITFQYLTPDGLRGIAPAVRSLARAEGLQAHERALDMRLEGVA